MKAFIRKRSRRQVMIVFGVAFGLLAAMAMFPPLYLVSSGVRTAVLSMPFTMFYWLLNGVLIFILTWGLSLVEGVRGELDTEVSTTDQDEAASAGHSAANMEGTGG